jgi:hypothetical protein
MKRKLIVLSVLAFLPLMLMAQNFDFKKALSETDQQLFEKEIFKHSVLLQSISAGMSKAIDIGEAEAGELVKTKLEELNSPVLNNMYSQVSKENMIKIGLLLYLALSGINDLPDPYEAQLTFGAGFGFFLMYTLANFVLMPELYYMWQGYKEEYSGNSATARFSQVALSLTMLYILRAQVLNFVLGLSPQFYYSLSGKIKEDGEPDEDIEFGGDYGARRLQMYLGLSAGIMLQNAMMIRLMYSLGLTKIYKNQDPRPYLIALIITMPLWSLN